LISISQDKKKEKKQRNVPAGVEDRNRKGGVFSLRSGTSSNSPSIKSEWRTPKEILASYQKQRLGKV
jgi:hypothetical protein